MYWFDRHFHTLISCSKWDWRISFPVSSLVGCLRTILTACWTCLPFSNVKASLTTLKPPTPIWRPIMYGPISWPSSSGAGVGAVVWAKLESHYKQDQLMIHTHWWYHFGRTVGNTVVGGCVYECRLARVTTKWIRLGARNAIGVGRCLLRVVQGTKRRARCFRAPLGWEREASRGLRCIRQITGRRICREHVCRGRVGVVGVKSTGRVWERRGELGVQGRGMLLRNAHSRSGAEERSLRLAHGSHPHVLVTEEVVFVKVVVLVVRCCLCLGDGSKAWGSYFSLTSSVDCQVERSLVLVSVGLVVFSCDVCHCIYILGGWGTVTDKGQFSKGWGSTAEFPYDSPERGRDEMR